MAESKKKGVKYWLDRYFVQAMSAMALGLLQKPDEDKAIQSAYSAGRGLMVI